MAGKLKNQNRTKKVSGKNTQKLPPYHVFMVLDEFFMLETCTMQFYQIDKLTYELLCLCATMSIDESKQKLYTIYPSCIDIIDSVCKEVKLLASEGLFEAPNNYTEKLNVSEFLDSYDFEKHWGGGRTKPCKLL